ncbi:MAG: Asp23/Gls24 family envelope stress response protein [Candidatus Acidiferrales bacterium]
MNKIQKRIGIAILAPFAIALFIWIGGELVMRLWNWLLPTLFGWRQITFWQSVGLLALCRILFGGWSGSGHGPRSNMRRRIDQRMDERWEKMTPEEREKFRQSWRSRCGGFAAPTGETPASGTKDPA